MIRILYFASLRETLDCAEETMEIKHPETIASLMQILKSRDTHWKSVFSAESTPVLYAINQEMVKIDALIKDGDEVAFFPPVTGG